MGKYGTNLEGFGAFEGGVNADNGAALISTNSAGEQSAIFGHTPLREILSGVTNGDFAAIPNDPSSVISEANALPYWLFTDVNSAGAITCTIVEDANLASGNKLRWSIANNTASGKSAKISRLQPVLGDGGGDSCYSFEAIFTPSGTSTQITVTSTLEYIKSDGSTAAAVTPSLTTTATLTTLSSAPTQFVPNVTTTEMAIPPAAAFLRITITVATVALVTAARTVDLSSMRLSRGAPRLWVAESFDPSTKAPASIDQENGVLSILNGSGTGFELSSGMVTVMNGGLQLVGTAYATSLSLDGTGKTTIALTDTTTTTGMTIGADTNLYRSAADTLKTDDAFTAVGNITGANIYPGGSTTRYWNISDSAVSTNGILQARSGTAGTGSEVRSRGTTTYCGFYWNGTYFTITDPLKIDGTTPTTASAANMRLNATTGGIVQFSTSSRRWKDNIEDVDAQTLAAAKRLKARHFTSKHEEDHGKRLLGMIAEEVDESGLDCAVERDAEGLPYAIDWNAITAALLSRLEDAERRIAELEAKA